MENKDLTNVGNEYPLLSQKEERELVRIIRKFKDGTQKQAAIEKLALSNIKLVMQISNGYYRRLCGITEIPSIHLADLFGAGKIGLMKAVEGFNPQKFNTRFSTYAYTWIQRTITMYIYSFYDSIHIPMALSDQLRRLLKIEAEQELPNEEDCMKRLGIDQEQLAKIRRAKKQIVALDHPASQEHDGSLHEIMNISSETPHVISEYEKKEFLAVVLRELQEMDGIYREVLEMRYLSYDDTPSLREVAKAYGISGERIRQIEVMALDKLKKRVKKVAGEI